MHGALVVLLNGWVLVVKNIDVNSGEREYVAKSGGIIRRWGTETGLGQLVKGPTPNTVLDKLPGEVRFPSSSVIWMMVLEEATVKKFGV